MILPQSILGLLLSFHFTSTDQNPFPQDYFSPPVSFPVYLSGSFSELRPNHFHSGIDIKTLGQEGVPLIAAADGYVSRVKVLHNGLGKALYLDHPNGYTTVYGHVIGFEKRIEAYVKENQYARQNFEIDIKPEKGRFQYKKGDTIAFSGNTGSSLGPHLHFEIRHTATEWPINPLLFGLKINDNIPPKIKKIRLYPIGERSLVEVEYYGKNGTYRKRYQDAFNLRIRKKTNHYELTGVKHIFVRGKIGVGVEIVDYMNGSHNTLDLYEGILKLDDSIIYSQQRNTFGFEQTRYINAHLDYAYMQKHRTKYQRFYKLPGNKLPFYNNLVNDGIIEIETLDTFKLLIEARDYNGNTSMLKFDLHYLDIDILNIPPVQIDTSYVTYFSYDNTNQYVVDGISIYFPEGTFYEDFYFKYDRIPGNRYLYSPVHKLHNNSIPVHTRYMLKINADQVPEKYREKAVVVGYINERSYWSNGGQYEDGWMIAHPRGLGNFSIMVDTVAPIIKQVNMWNNSNMRYKKNIMLKIYDNLSGIQSYYPTINGNWVLMEHDGKKNLLTYTFDDNIGDGEHSFKIIVTDRRNNIKELNLNFKR